MGSRQESLIYIEKENRTEAEFMSRSFVDKEIRNRAYINALGAELGMKYLASEGFDTEDVHNLHSISKLLEKYDIADILLPNIHIDVRVVFDEKQIFIPKSHYKMEITPDIYMILKLDKSFEHVEFLGFIESEKVSFKNSNVDYYFIEKNKLTSSDKLKQYIKDYTGTTSRDISEEDMLRGRELSIALADHNISQDEEIELIELLLSSDVLRESVLEFDNFETLAYNVSKTLAERFSNDATVVLPVIDEDSQDEEINIDDVQEIVFNEEFFADEEEKQEDESAEQEVLEQEEVQVLDIQEPEVQEQEEVQALDIQEPETQEQEEVQVLDIQEPEVQEQEEVGEQDIQDSVEDVSEETLSFEEPVLDENLSEEETLVDEPEDSLPDFSNDIDLSDSLLEHEEINQELDVETVSPEISDNEEHLTVDPLPETVLDVSAPVQVSDLAPEASSEELVDNILDKLIDGNDNVSKPDSNKDLAQTVSDAIQKSLEKGTQAAAIAAAGTASALAAEAVADAGVIATGAAATDGAIKLAGVAGDLISNVVEQNVEKQQKNLDRIDYAKTDIAPDVAEIPEHIKALGDLSIAKMEANKEAEASGQFETPQDLNDLKQVDNIHEEISVEQEIIDLNAMETVELDNIVEENSDSIVNLSSINVDSPTKPVENTAELKGDAEFVGMDLPDLSSYTINEDGTSNMDNFAQDINFDDTSDENLLDMKLNDIDNLTIDENYHEDFSSDMGNVQAEDLFAGDKIITQNIDDEPAADFGSEDFSSQDEIISLDSQENEFDDLNAIENTESLEIPVEDELETLNQHEETFVTVDNDMVEEVAADENLSEDILTKDLSAQEINMEDFAEFEPVSENEEISDLEFSTVEPLQDDVSEQTVQDWVEDTNYDNLQDVEITPETAQLQEDMIVEPEQVQEKHFAVVENSTVISDRNYKVGEIPIDINEQKIPQMPGDESLEHLYNSDGSNIAGGALLQTPGRLGTGSGMQKGGLGGMMKIVGGLIVLAVVCVIGFNVAKMFKAPTEETPQPITDDAVPTVPETTAADNNALDVNPENVVTMDNTTDALANPTTLKQTQPQAQTPVASAAKKQGSAMLSISKLTWEVPDYISYNPQFKQYFQAVGKSLKLSLTSDLLLATDYAYSNEVKVSVTFAKDGVFKSAQIFKSSGSTQIDNIVLQTVNQTLKALKAPQSVGNDESTTAILKIYF